MKDTTKILNRIAQLIEKGQKVVDSYKPNQFVALDTETFNEWRTQALAFLKNILGNEHVYVHYFTTEVDKGTLGRAKAGLGILRGVHEDIEGGYLVELQALISAEVFSDFIDMAQHLFDKKYIPPAASLCGAVLENSLRRILSNAGGKVTDKDDLNSLNQKCIDAGIYNQVKRKEIQLWTDIRNKADHGKFKDIDERQVKNMLEDVVHFLGEYLR